jgi:hypothetical protein
VFSVIDRASFDHLAGWLEEARKNAGNVPGILIGNKTDLPDQRVVSREEAEEFSAQMGLRYIETSAKMDENVGDAFRKVAITIMQTKPEYGIKDEVATPAEPATPAPEPESVASQPVDPQPAVDEIGIEPVVSEAAPEFLEPDPEPIPLLVDEPEPEAVIQPEPVVPEPEAVVPIEPPPVSEPEPVVISSPEAVEPEPEDIVVETKAFSSLVEFVGVDPQSLSIDDFEKRSVHAMQRLGVSEVGVLGTFLRSLIRQGQRDVVIESLESLQEDR